MKPKTKKIFASCALSLPLLASSVLCPILAVRQASADDGLVPYTANKFLSGFDFELVCEEVEDDSLSYDSTYFFYDSIGYLPTTIALGDIYDTQNDYSLTINNFTTDVEQYTEWATTKMWRLYTYFAGIELECTSLSVLHEAPVMLPLYDLDRWSFYVNCETGSAPYWSLSYEVYDTATHEWYTFNRGASSGSLVYLDEIINGNEPTVIYRNQEYVLCREFRLTFQLYSAWGVSFSLSSIDDFAESTNTTLAQDYIYTDVLSPTIVEEIVPTPSEVFFGMVDDFLSTEFMPNFTFGDLCLIALGISAFFMFLKIWMGG